MPGSNPIKRLFDLYTSDLSYQEIERLIKQEAGEVYEFFAKEIPKPDKNKSKLRRGLIFGRSLFNAFILKLTPARRVFYLAAILFFIVGYYSPNNAYLLLSFIILNLLIAFELADKLSAKGELEVAQKIQSVLIPKHSPKIFNYEVASYYEPAREVGGDYFDLIETKENAFLVVGDISGKGMAAALYMVRAQAIIHMLLENLSAVKEIIIDLKKYFSKNLKKEYFLTLSMASIDREGRVKICRAGHMPTFWYKKQIDDFEVISPSGIAIGLNDRGIFEKTLEEISIQPSENDILFFFTDGISEAMNERFQMFGEERIKQVIKKYADRPASDIRAMLLTSLSLFRGTAAQNDDLTFVILKADQFSS